MTSEEARGVPVFACCSAGIGRWFWVAWESEAEARALSDPLATGFEASADRCEAKVATRLGREIKRLPTKWASGYRRRGSTPARVPGTEGGVEAKPRSRFGRPGGPPKGGQAAPRLTFLYSATEREPPDALGQVTVTRHRIVKQTAGKIHVEYAPFDEDEWARLAGRAGEPPGAAAKPRTLAVDRTTLRTEGRFKSGRTYHGLTLYASEADGIRDVEEALTAKHAWCARLGVRFPCSVGSVKVAYRRLAAASHPDAGGDPAEFRATEQAYRAALAYFATGTDATD